MHNHKITGHQGIMAHMSNTSYSFIIFNYDLN